MAALTRIASRGLFRGVHTACVAAVVRGHGYRARSWGGALAPKGPWGFSAAQQVLGLPRRSCRWGLETVEGEGGWDAMDAWVLAPRTEQLWTP